MSDDWKKGYKQALMNAFAREASIRSDYRYYARAGGLDYQASAKLAAHLKNCNISVENSSMPEDSSWHEFMGTFYEGDTTIYGLDANITCECNKFENVAMRMTGTFSELLQAVLREA